MEKKLEEIMSQVIEKAKNAQESDCPEILIDDRLEDAFLSPEYDEEGYSDPIPAIYNDYGYGKDEDGVLILTLKSASLETNLYTKYLDDEAFVWDTAKEELFLYIPDPDSPKVAFKAGRWRYAKKLKPKYSLLSLHEIYLEKMK